MTPISLTATTLCALVAADAPPPFKISTKRADDTVDVRTDGGRAVFAVTSPCGISRATVERTGDKWPDAVVVRLRLKGLEGFAVDNGTVKLSHPAPDDAAAANDRLDVRVVDGDGKPATGAEKQRWYEVTLPKAFFAANPRAITLDWVDFYRR